MKEKNRIRSKIAAFFRGILLLVIVAVLAAAGFTAAWAATSRPALFVSEREVTMEAGDAFNPRIAGYTLENADESDLIVQKGGLDTTAPGSYTVTYLLSLPEMERLVEYISPNPHTSAEVTVHVEDTTLPKLSVIEGPLVVAAGESVGTRDVVKSAEDLTGVRVYFEGGATEQIFSEEGESQVIVFAEDTSGNKVSAGVEVVARKPDMEPPRIYGTQDTVALTGSAFDPMEGVAVGDNDDPEPVLTVDPAGIDTSVPGVYTVTYSAEDNYGNRREEKRTVTVADRIGQYNGGSYPIYWDNAGVVNQPYLVAVNRLLNVATVYQQDEDGTYTVPVRACLVSTGPATPLGRFATQERYRWHYLFEDSWGQYATRISGHILFHSVPYFRQDPGSLEYEEFNQLGTSASLGCIRMCVEDVKWIYDNCPDGFPCCIYENGDHPGPMGRPDGLRIDEGNESLRGWDPTDPDPGNPWHPSGGGTAVQ